MKTERGSSMKKILLGLAVALLGTCLLFGTANASIITLHQADLLNMTVVDGATEGEFGAAVDGYGVRFTDELLSGDTSYIGFSSTPPVTSVTAGDVFRLDFENTNNNDLSAVGLWIEIDGNRYESASLYTLAAIDPPGPISVALALNIGVTGTVTNLGWIIQNVEDEKDVYHMTVNPVPIPAAVWLLGSGLIGLVGLRRKLPS